MDVSGGQQVDVDHDIKKRRLKADGTRISEEKVQELGNGTALLDPNRSVTLAQFLSRDHIFCHVITMSCRLVNTVFTF